VKPINKKPRSWVLTIILAGSAIAYVAFVFLPGQRAIGEMRKQLHEKQEFIVQADRLTFAIQKAADDMQAALEFAEEWRSHAPSEGKLAATFGRITECAQTAGLAVQRFDPQPVVRLDSIWQAPVSLVAEGEFSQVFEFLGAIEALPSTVWIQNLRLENSGKVSGRLRCEMTLTVFADNRDFSE
jgi:Tfp pilus assembly protein PilO